MQDSLPNSSFTTLQPSDSGSYCYWDVRGDADFIIICCNLALSLLIVSQVIIAYKRSVLYLEPGPHFRIYYFLYAWFVAYVVEYLFAAIAYYINFRDKSTRWKSDIVLYSRVFQFMDFFAAFLLLGCLYYVAFLLLHRIHDLCERRGHHPSKWQLHFYTFLKTYLKVRILEIVPTFVLLLLPDAENNSLRICSQIELAFFLFDSVMCNVSLLVATTTIRRKNELLNTENEQEKRKLMRQSVLLQIAGITRLGMGVIFIIISGSSNQCPKPATDRTYLYLLVGHIVMHFLPAIVVLSIFRMSSSEIRRANSQDFSNNIKTTLNQ